MSTAASRIGAGGVASTSASTAGASSTPSLLLLTAPQQLRRYRRRRCCCLDSSNATFLNRRSASNVIRALHSSENGSQFSLSAERRRPRTMSSSASSSSSSSLAASAFGLGRSSGSSSSKGKKGPVVVIDNYDSFTYNLCQVRSFCSVVEMAEEKLNTFFDLADCFSFVVIVVVVKKTRP